MKKPRPFLAEKRATPTKVRGRVDICNRDPESVWRIHQVLRGICNQMATRDNGMSGQQHEGSGVVTPILAAFLAYSPNRTRPRPSKSWGALGNRLRFGISLLIFVLQKQVCGVQQMVARHLVLRLQSIP